MRGLKVAEVLFLLSFITIHVLADDVPKHLFPLGEKHDELVEKCAKDSGLTKDKLKELAEAAHKSADAPINKDFACFIKCLMTELGVIGSDGKINVSVAKENLPPKFADKASEVMSCLEKIDKIALCEDVEKIIKCLPKPPATN